MLCTEFRFIGTVEKNDIMTPLSRTFNDLLTGGKNWRLWMALANEDLAQRFRRTVIGVAWVSITFGLFIGAKVIVFGSIMKVPMAEYALYVTLGFLAWGFIIASVTDGCSVFANSENWIKGVNTPLSLFIYQSIARNFTMLLYSGLAGFLILLVMRHPLTFKALMAIPALAIYIVNAMWISMVMGVITARYRDVLHLVSTAMRIIFFLTPILWMPRQFGPGLRKYADYNPFTHYLAVFRQPILYDDFAWRSWIIVLCITAVGVILGLAVFSKFRKRIVFWL